MLVVYLRKLMKLMAEVADLYKINHNKNEFLMQYKINFIDLCDFNYSIICFNIFF